MPIDPSPTLAHTTADIGVTSSAALAANASRTWALIINDSAVIIYLKVGAAAVANEGIRLAANGGAFEMSGALGNLDTRVINAIAASGASNRLTVTEGTSTLTDRGFET